MMVVFTLLFLFAVLPSLFQDVKMRHDMTEENEEDSRDTGTENEKQKKHETKKEDSHSNAMKFFTTSEKRGLK